MAIHIKPVRFSVQGDIVRAELFLPRGVPRPPVVLMAHSLCGTPRFCLPECAWHFAARGLAVLVFDCRDLEDGGVRARQLGDPARHLQDYAAALDFLKHCPDVDGSRIALWGAALGGGHALVTAARHAQDIRAVVAFNPHVDGRFSAVVYPRRPLPARRPADAAAAPGQPPACVPGGAGCGGCMPARRSEWAAAGPARLRLRITRYRPVREAAHIRCPVLMVASPGADLHTPPSAVARTAARIRDCRLEMMALAPGEAGSEGRRCLIRLQSDFLCEKLQVPLPAARNLRPRRPPPRRRAPAAAEAMPAPLPRLC